MNIKRISLSIVFQVMLFSSHGYGQNEPILSVVATSGYSSDVFDWTVGESALDPEPDDSYTVGFNQGFDEKKPNAVESFYWNLNTTIYPNPFSQVLKLEYELNDNSHVRIEVYDIVGKQVDLIESKSVTRGKHFLEWNPLALNNGVYFLTITIDNNSKSYRIILN